MPPFRLQGSGAGCCVKLLRKIVGLGVIAAVLATASPLAAQAVSDPTNPAAPAAPDKPGQGPLSPFTFTAAYNADLLDDAGGGRRPGAGYTGLVKLAAAYDGSTAGHEGLTGLVSIEDSSGSDFTGRHVGGVQAISASEAEPQALRLYEVWLQQDILHGQGGLRPA